jgi:biopolymer transport protein TolQ
METEALGAAQAIDFSMWGMFIRSSIVVKLVTISLIFASFLVWAVAVDKWLEFRRVRRDLQMFEDAFWSGQPLDALYDRVGQKPRSAIERIFSAGMAEWRRSYDKGGAVLAGARERIDRQIDVALARETDALGDRLLTLATIGSIAPFVGLFGTVWGIMTAFQQIAISQDTSLATVAPGIAEALVTTAIGLIAAVPGVMAYNAFSDRAQKLAAKLEAFADEFGVILSRQMVRAAA